MLVDDSASKMYMVVAGENKGRLCVLRDYIELDDSEMVNVIFVDNDNGKDDFVLVKRGFLSEVEIPGWEYSFPHARPCLLGEFLKKDRMQFKIRDVHVVQPPVVRKWDVLATDERIVEPPRRGYNSIVLLRLSSAGWIEIAPRLPIALKGNQKYKLPIELAAGDKLATGCVVFKKPESTKVNITDVCLNHGGSCLSVPSCIPLALA
ncbi:hypothetical protein HQ571_03525 [Candidatus Kuenenbacteria bacterium]|nr:hypothetical protein [Candidatus Kuenenbacteria bacterium]